jgi:hypothetical protein
LPAAGAGRVKSADRGTAAASAKNAEDRSSARARRALSVGTCFARRRYPATTIAAAVDSCAPTANGWRGAPQADEAAITASAAAVTPSQTALCAIFTDSHDRAGRQLHAESARRHVPERTLRSVSGFQSPRAAQVRRD